MYAISFVRFSGSFTAWYFLIPSHLVAIATDHITFDITSSDQNHDCDKSCSHVKPLKASKKLRKRFNRVEHSGSGLMMIVAAYGTLRISEPALQTKALRTSPAHGRCNSPCTRNMSPIPQQRIRDCSTSRSLRQRPGKSLKLYRNENAIIKLCC